MHMLNYHQYYLSQVHTVTHNSIVKVWWENVRTKWSESCCLITRVVGKVVYEYAKLTDVP